MLTSKLLNLALVGSEWVLWVLLVLSVVSIALIIERALLLAKVRSRSGMDDARRWWDRGASDEALSILEKSSNVSAKASAAAALHGEAGLRDTLGAEKLRMESKLWFLATVGSNAPFIGLLGTVLGIIHAFHSLSGNLSGGPEVVMAGISEALVATAVGLFVAIPAVVAYNLFVRTIRRTLSEAELSARYFLSTKLEKAA